jgi:glycosyltransferase involved in cell wall biosynthesis
MNPAALRRAAGDKLAVLLVPDSIYWILGTIAKGIARANPWVDATIISGPVLERVAKDDPEFFGRFDVVHFICPYASKTWLSRLRDCTPVVTSHHHVTEWSAVDHNVRGDAIITGSREWIDDLVSRGVDRERVISVPYGVDSNLFRPAEPGEKDRVRRRLGISTTGPVIGFFAKRASNDDDRKGIDVFASAIRLLHKKNPDASVVIVGPGWKELVAGFREEEIACVWIPFLEKLEDVAPVYRALDFYWVTARVEGGPVPLLEAMSSGICCLSTQVGLAREIVESGVNALTVAMNDPAGFANFTAELWNEPVRRNELAHNARDTIVTRMDVGHTLKGVAEAYSLSLRNFAARTGTQQRALPDTSKWAASLEPVDDEVPLGGLSDGLRKEIMSMEALEWSEHLMLFRGQRRAAIRLIAKAWAAQPLSLEPARILLRRFLPQFIVRRIVRIKHRSWRPV